MNDLKILNNINRYLQTDTAFELVKNENKISIRLQSSIETAFEVMAGRVDADAAIGKFIVSKLFQAGNSCKLRKAALKAAKQFQKMQSNNYNRLTRTSELSEVSKKISYYELIVKFSKKLNLPLRVLVENESLVGFINNNHLHNRIDNSYIERAFGPRLLDGQVLFPLNTGSSFISEDVRWVPHTEIPTDKKGKIQYTYGPFGFEPYNSDSATELRPIKLQKRPDNIISSSIRLELVTSTPTYNPLRIHQGSLGHGWIRVYQLEINAQGEDTGKDFMYSFGYYMGKCLKTPDPADFVPGKKLVTNSVEITPEKWAEMKIYLETVQAGLKGKKMTDPMIKRDVRNIHFGTCCNFSTTVFKRASGKKIDGRLWLMKQLKCVTQPAGSVMKNIVPRFVSQWCSRLQNGVFPGTLISEQAVLV